jgi:4a-hydroxytetrahydrobiopterin dehydratase
MMKVLDAKGLQEAAGRLPQWTVSAEGIWREVTLKDFKEALELVNRVGEIAEAAGHHPDIDIRYNRVKLLLVTHDAGGVTASDVEMAERLERAISKK